MRGAEWPALLVRADTAYMPSLLTETAASDPTTPEAVGGSKINSNCARPTDGQSASPSPPTNPGSDITLAASI